MLIQSRVVEPHVRIRVKRLLPTVGEIVTGVGQSVTPMQVVARSGKEVRYHVLPLSDQLQILPEELPRLLDLSPGTRVRQGMTLIDRKGFLGRRQQYHSPLEGEVYAVENGRLILRQTSDIDELRALVAGQVVEHIPQRGVVLETFGALIQVAWSSDHEDAGLLQMLSPRPDALFMPEQITAECQSAIIVVGYFDQPKVLQRAREVGVRGIICGSLPADLCRLATSGDLPIFVTDGIGDFGMSAPVYDILRVADGRRTALLGRHTDVGRGQIVLQADSKTTHTPPLATDPLAPGQRVRLLRGPHLNQVGEVIRLYRLAQTTTGGIRARGADVRLASGQTLFVPYANLEAII
jgi:hypothetical protein